MQFMLDTNVLIYAIRPEPDVTQTLQELIDANQELMVPTVAVIEFLAFPALTARERHALQQFLRRATVADLTLPIAFAAGELRRQHRLKLGDSIVAATALETRAVLLTRNERDFRKVSGLVVRPV